MSRNKTKKFSETDELSNIIQPGKELYDKIKGNWSELFFKNNNPIVLELACGYGEYTIGLAERYPDINFIGVDIKGDRIWRGAKQAVEKKLDNVGFMRCMIHSLENFFQDNEVDGIWLIHPDPRPRDKDEKRRLVYPRFLQIYQKLLKLDGWMRFKTDSASLFEYGKEVIGDIKVRDYEFTDDLYNSPLYAEHHEIVTKYEKIFREQGHNIHYMKFRFCEDTVIKIPPKKVKTTEEES